MLSTSFVLSISSDNYYKANADTYFIAILGKLLTHPFLPWTRGWCVLFAFICVAFHDNFGRIHTCSRNPYEIFSWDSNSQLPSLVIYPIKSNSVFHSRFLSPAKECWSAFKEQNNCSPQIDLIYIYIYIHTHIYIIYILNIYVYKYIICLYTLKCHYKERVYYKREWWLKNVII